MVRQPRRVRSKFWTGLTALGALTLGLAIAWPSSGHQISTVPGSYRHMDDRLFEQVEVSESASYIAPIYETLPVRPDPTRAAIVVKQEVQVVTPKPKPTAKPVTRVTSNLSIAEGRMLAKTYAKSRMSSTQYQCLVKLWDHESGWNYRDLNTSSGAYGIPQALPGSKMKSAGSDWKTNPITQVKWGLGYIKGRYGTPCGAWSYWTNHRWY